VTIRAKEVLHEALRLSARERAQVASELLASIGGAVDQDTESAWANEIERRARRAIVGKSVGRDWSAVRERLRKATRHR
jgi:putative addiction module component (TIGR02574 family)